MFRVGRRLTVSEDHQRVRKPQYHLSVAVRFSFGFWMVYYNYAEEQEGVRVKMRGLKILLVGGV